MRVKEAMTRKIIAVAPETSLKKVAAILPEHGISPVPVCDRDG